MAVADEDLELLLQDALRQRPRKRLRVDSRETAEDYADRLAEKAKYRRLFDESNANLDAERFRFYFEGHEGMNLDQWRAVIDCRIERNKG